MERRFNIYSIIWIYVKTAFKKYLQMYYGYVIFEDIFKWFEDIYKWFEDIFKSFEDIFKWIEDIFKLYYL